jgi:predicted amidohydrolase
MEKSIDYAPTIKLEQVTIMLVQLKYEDFDWKKIKGLHYLVDNDRFTRVLDNILQQAAENSIDVLVFPELSIPQTAIEKIALWSGAQKCLVIAGSHYHNTKKNGTINRCPVINEGSVEFVEKKNPSPHELSPIRGEGCSSGERLGKSIFETKYGKFEVLICSDYLHSERHPHSEGTDFIFVIAFQDNSEDFFRRFNIECQNSKDGVFIAYSNFFGLPFGDGNSSFYGDMDIIYKEAFYEKTFTSRRDEYQLFKFSPSDEIAIFAFDIMNKKIFKRRNVNNTKPNAFFISRTGKLSNDESEFLSKIGHSEDRFRRINEFYVEPEEYSSILQTLEDSGVVIIIGEAGLGKTYTAVKLLKDHFTNGYEPKWYAGGSQEDRNNQARLLSDFEPESNKIYYFEDPFGGKIYERNDNLFNCLDELIERVSKTQSRVIITSRKEIFHNFSVEAILSDKIRNCCHELSVQRNSYTEEKLQLLLTKLSKGCKWASKPKLENYVRKAITSKKMVTPLIIRDFILSSRDIDKIQLLDEKIKQRGPEMLKTFAYDLKHLPLTTRLFLVIIYMSGKDGHSIIEELYNYLIDQKQLNLKTLTTSFKMEVRNQNGYRIEKFGAVKTQYKFTHPLYEDAVAKLIEIDYPTEVLIKSLVLKLANEDVHGAYLRINKIVDKHPKVALILYRHLLENDIKLDKFRSKVVLTSKLLSTYFRTKQIEFFETAELFYSLESVVNDLNQTNSKIHPKDLQEILVLARRFKNCSPKDYDTNSLNEINWNRVFTVDFSSLKSAENLLQILFNTFKINPESIGYFIKNNNPNTIKSSLFQLNKKGRYSYVKLLRNSSIGPDLTKYFNMLEDPGANQTAITKDLFIKILFDERKYYGKLILDDGAKRAFQKKWPNLFPVGVIRVQMTFRKGHVVGVFDENENFLGVGLSEYSNDELVRVIGKKSPEIIEILGARRSTSVLKERFIHRFSSEEEKLLWKSEDL